MLELFKKKMQEAADSAKGRSSGAAVGKGSTRDAYLSYVDEKTSKGEQPVTFAEFAGGKR